MIVVSLATAANIVSDNLRGRALGIIFMGIVLGVPLGTLIGNNFGWRMTFLLVAVLALVSIIGIMKFLPKVPTDRTVSLQKQFAALRGKTVISLHGISILMYTGQFTLYTYLIPFLHETMGLAKRLNSIILIFFGVAGVFGGWLGGWSTDKFGSVRTILVSLLLVVCHYSLYLMPPNQCPLY
ncbi:MFS transporter [Bacillus sp. T33-2]|uniref:MFS transporter n=1 Tax=Bacillus sp. T33-2 TaxID=2054168 RepID=UPI0015E1598E|nr:MFS transporter [Bacillus sp. T33-2]